MIEILTLSSSLPNVNEGAAVCGMLISPSNIFLNADRVRGDSRKGVHDALLIMVCWSSRASSPPSFDRRKILRLRSTRGADGLAITSRTCGLELEMTRAHGINEPRA